MSRQSKLEQRNAARAARETHGQSYADEMNRAHEGDIVIDGQAVLDDGLHDDETHSTPSRTAAEHGKFAATLAGQVAAAASTLATWLNMPRIMRAAEFARFAAQAAPVLVSLKDLYPPTRK